MQDRFRFRCWRKLDNRMVEIYWFNPILFDEDTAGDRAKNYVLMQCTGLKDKHGKLIYEGDIVKNFHVSSSMQGRVFIGYVVYDDTRCRFHIQENKHCGYITFSNTDDIFEVIGNIYENKELLSE